MSTKGSESENLSRIKEILFGEDLQSIEQKLSIFKKENAEINNQLKTEIEEILNKIEFKINDIAQKAEQTTVIQAESQKDIKTELKQEITNINIEVKKEKQVFENNLNQKTDEIMQRIALLEENLNKSVENIHNKIDSKVTLLEDAKINNDDLVNLFLEMADRLKK